jgi:hypothetical protein
MSPPLASVLPSPPLLATSGANLRSPRLAVFLAVGSECPPRGRYRTGRSQAPAVIVSVGVVRSILPRMARSPGRIAHRCRAFSQASRSPPIAAVATISSACARKAPWGSVSFDKVPQRPPGIMGRLARAPRWRRRSTSTTIRRRQRGNAWQRNRRGISSAGAFFLVRKKGVALGTVEAPDAETAVKIAAEGHATFCRPGSHHDHRAHSTRRSVSSTGMRGLQRRD